MRHQATSESFLQHPVSDEAGWVESRLLREMLNTDRASYRWVFLVFPILVVMLHGRVATPALVLWAAAMCVMLILRVRLIWRYPMGDDPASCQARAELMRRHGWVWLLSALLWGSSAWLYQMPGAMESQESLCLLVLAGLGGYAVTSYAPHLPTVRRYIHGLCGMIITSIIFDLVFEGDKTDDNYEYWLLLLAVLYWQFLLLNGRRLHNIHRGNFELQFRNQHLIESLTQQSAAAHSAMEIKNRFLASAAHDIRQPVHALSLYAELLAAEPHLADEITPKIVKSTKAVNALFESLFDLVQLDSGKFRVKVEAIDLPRFLHELELQYRPRAEARGLQFRVRVRPGEILSDPILLRRVVGNLLDNAVKYTQEGGVLLAARFASDRVRIEVHDTGSGIAPEYQQQVFQEFYKVPERQGSADGFGLGLAIVARLTSVLGHRLTMSSRVRRGTSFRLELQSLDTVDSDQRANRTIL